MQERLSIECWEEDDSLIYIDEQLQKMRRNPHFAFYNCGEAERSFEIAIIDKSKFTLNEIEYKLSLLEKIALVKNIYPDNISIVEIHNGWIDRGFKYGEYNFNNIIKTNMENCNYDVSKFSSETRLELVEFLKEQNEIILKNFKDPKSKYTLFNILQIDLIFKISEKNEIKYMAALFERYGLNFEEIIYLMIDDMSYMLKNQTNKDIINQYIDFYGTSNIEKMYKDFKEDNSNFTFEHFGNKFHVGNVSKEMLNFIFRVTNDKTKIFFDEHSNAVNKFDNKISLNNEYLSLSLDDVLNEMNLKIIHKQINEALRYELAYSLNFDTVYVINGDINKLEESYNSVFREMINSQKKPGEKEIREICLRVLLEKKEQKLTKVKTKV